MIIIKEVKTFMQGIKFTEFPNKMYKKVEPFVPALSMDERNVFSKKKNPAHEYIDSIRFLAYKDNKIVGRIAGLINHSINKSQNIKQVRFTRIDMIDDLEVTKALINAVESWGKSQGMNEIIGPIGFTDLDRQGMLVDGFDELNMFITIYNFPYYHEHLEKLGFNKDVDWVEKQLYLAEAPIEKISKASEIVRRRYGFELISPKNKKEIFKYAYEAFDIYNEAFQVLYGFYPITEKVMTYYIKQMMSIVQLDYLWFVLNKEKNVIGFGILMPSLALANKKSNGKLFPFGWARILKSLKNYDVFDFYFIAVDPKYQNSGVFSLIMEDGIKKAIKHNIKFAETGPELEENVAINSQWKDFKYREHKRRRCYKKDL